MSTLHETLGKQRLSRRDLLRWSAFATTGALLAACAPGIAPSGATTGDSAPAQAKVRIVATTQMPIEQWQPAVERAVDQLPEVDLVLTQTNISEGGWAGYSDRIVTQIAGGEQLDVIMIAIEGLGLLTDKKILVPLDDFFLADPTEKAILDNDIHPVLREMLQVDGKQMEYPFSWNNMVMYYNTSVFEEAGVEPPAAEWTWEDFLDTCLKVPTCRATPTTAMPIPSGAMECLAWQPGTSTTIPPP